MPVRTPKLQKEVCPASAKPDVGGGDAENMSRFKPPTMEKIINQLSAKTFAENTQRKVQLAVGLFDSWHQHRLSLPMCSHEIMFCNIRDPKRVNKVHLGQVLCFFINEIRRKDSVEYEARTLYDIVICLQFHFESTGLFWKLIDDPEFTNLKWTLDNLMKARCTEKLGTTSKAHPISFEDEEIM